MKINAPFTKEQVARLIEWQSGIAWQTDLNGIVVPLPAHPFTCPAEDAYKCPGQGILIPKTDGMHCPCGKHTLTWCYDFMANQPETNELSELFKRVVKLAAEKEYYFITELLNPAGYEFWRMDSMRYVNVVCSLLSEWLRSEHSVLVWVEPIGRPEGVFLFKAYCDMDSQQLGLATVPINLDQQSSYEFVWLAGIEHALKSLPPAVPQ